MLYDFFRRGRKNASTFEVKRKGVYFKTLWRFLEGGISCDWIFMIEETVPFVSGIP